MYLRGLSGLISYGSDEAYISIKAWLSGGKCLILKDVIVGHLYRKDPPYAVKHIDYVYNKVLVSLLLLPNDICLKVTSVPLKLGRYKKSNKLGSLESHRSLSY
ncbi:hypothetical protein FACS1894174_06570 [Bacteroidia bacterium]|nr:hypothetical protein FACS1894174_06570 [Bacteroidia bacterium]